MSAFFTLHRDLPREGPGSAAEVDWVLDRIPPPARVIDAACGPGADTVTLAERLPGARIAAVDRQAHFIAEARRRCARFGGRVSVDEGDLREPTGPADLIWCMGAAYIVGLEAALAAWRPALAPGGVVAVSEPVLTETPPDPVVAAFWQGEAVGTAGTLAARVAAAGFRTLDTRLVTGSPWAEYYDPIHARIAALRPAADPALATVLDETAREIALWRQAPDRIAYLLILAAPP